MKQYFRHMAFGLAVALAACALYWGQLFNSQRTQLQYAEEQISFRATRLAEALAIQVNTLFSGLEYLSNSLANAYMTEGRRYFPMMVQTAFRTFPRDSIVQVSVADAKGDLVYSSLRDEIPKPAAGQSLGSIADREHFRVHLDNPDSKAFVSRPVFGRISERWTIQMSQAMRRDGEFLGVVILSVAPSYVSGYFREVFTSVGDSAALVYVDGSYMARSSREEYAMDKKVPADRPFLHDLRASAGTFRSTPEIDPVERLYAWHRVTDYPLLVTIGLEREAGLQAVERLQLASVKYSLVATAVFLIFACWIAWLVARLKRDHVLLEESEQRLKLALKGGELGSWEWNAETNEFRYDGACASMLGYGPGELSGSPDFFMGLFHPDERDNVLGEVYRHYRGETPFFESEHRMRHKMGHWVWVSARGGVSSRNAQGEVMRMAGVQADISLQKEDARLRKALFDNSAADVLLLNPRTRMIRSSNRHADQTFSPDGQSLAGKSAASLHLSEENARRFESIYTELQLRGTVQVEAPLRNGKGEERWYSINGTLLDHSAPDGDVIWTMLDITQRRQMEQSLADAWVRLTQVIEHFPGGVLVEDENGTILVINQMFCDLLHLSGEAASMAGSRTEEVAAGLAPEDAAQLCASLPTAGDISVNLLDEELAYRDKMLHVTITRIRRGPRNRGRLWVIEDVTERLKHESDLNRMATTDALTGLPNRAAFLSRLDGVLAAAPASLRRGVLLMADLDRFKQVNDTYGHGAGDEVLRFLASLFQSVLRQDDMAGRLGGEEFVVLLPDASEEIAWQVAERLRVALENSEIPTLAGVVRITISIGMAHLQAGEAAEILAAADAALYRAKRGGRNRIEAAWADAGEA